MSDGVYEQRRARVLEAMGPRGVAIFFSGGESVRSRDTTYPYRASSDVLYLTGFEEPEAVVVLGACMEAGPLAMFVRPRDPEQEIWHGRRAGVEGARERFGADAAFEIGSLAKELPRLLEEAEEIHYQLGQPSDALVIGAVGGLRARRGKAPAGPTVWRDARALVHPLRLIKRPEELSLLRAACALTAEAHLAAMKACRPGMHEYELQALIECIFVKNGALAPAYGTIVGAGVNATILHYTENRSAIGPEDLVLIDAGAELGYYAGDITRTFPASGRFSGVQRDVYQAVLEAEEAGIELCRVGSSWQSIHEATVKSLTQSMVDLGLLNGQVDALIEDESYKKFYMHKTGHWLGMDVHDVGPYYEGQQASSLQVGVVQTIEPGIYIQHGAEGVDERFWGIGVRIEDDVLTTADGPEVLTSGVPKSVEAIEALVGSGYQLSF